MQFRGRVRAMVLGLASAGLVALAACAPIPTVVDTPKNGDRYDLAVNQPMQVRWSNMSPDRGSWVLEEGPTTPAVTLVGRTEQPPAGGAFALDIFDFVGAQKGADRLTFVYKHHDGRPPSPDERITIEVGVG